MAECSRCPRVNWGLGAAGAVLLALSSAEVLAQSRDEGDWMTIILLASALPFFVGGWLVLRNTCGRSTLVIVLVVAALMRLIALVAPPYLSSDLYRYIWDGRVQAAGINPYRYYPADQALAGLRDATIYPHINRRDYAHTIYPPVAQAVFLATTRLSESTFWMKATMLLAELVAIAAMAKLLVLNGLSPARLVFYAWHPVPVWELAGSGHVDALMVAGVTLALLCAWRGRALATGAALAAATLVKFFPLVLFPVFQRRWDWKMPAAFVGGAGLAYLPYYFTAGEHLSWGEKLRTVFGFFGSYTSEEGMRNGSGFFALQLLPFVPSALYLAIAALVMAAIALYAWLTPPADSLSVIRRAFAMVAAVIVFTSPHYPWYVCWAIPFLCFVPSLAFLWLTAAMPVLYFTWAHADARSFFWMNAFIYLPAAALAIYSWQRRRISL